MIFLFFIYLQLATQNFPIFSPEDEKIEERENSSIFIKWDSLNFYLYYKTEEKVNTILFLGNGIYGIKNIKLDREYVFLKPMSIILFSDGKKFIVRDSMLIPIVSDSIHVNNSFFKIPKRFLPETTIYIYFALEVRKGDTIINFPEKKEYQFILPVYRVLVDANADLEWDMDIIPKAICEELYPPEEFYMLRIKMSRTILRKGESSYFIVSPQEDGYVSVSFFNEMGQKIGDIENAKWMVKDRDYLIEWTPEYERLKSGKYFCIFYFNGYPVLKIPLFIVK